MLTHQMLLDLSQWAASEDPLEKWLINEMVLTYDAYEEIAADSVETDQIAVLLDTLDALPKSDRSACVEAINSYQARHPRVPIVVCSRLKEYRHLDTQLELLRAVVASDRSLREALRMPLILSLVRFLPIAILPHEAR
jgi:hypothetical protein